MRITAVLIRDEIGGLVVVLSEFMDGGGVRLLGRGEKARRGNP
jgi:hypothetical protein